MTGFYLLAKIEEAIDKSIYDWTHHIVSGHTLKHLCAAMVPVFLTLMLAKRSVQPERYAYNLVCVHGHVCLCVCMHVSVWIPNHFPCMPLIMFFLPVSCHNLSAKYLL